jgi:hypothetical protein
MICRFLQPYIPAVINTVLGVNGDRQYLPIRKIRGSHRGEAAALGSGEGRMLTLRQEVPRAYCVITVRIKLHVYNGCTI